MAYYNKNWLLESYIEIFVNNTGSQPSEKEKEYLSQLLNISKETIGKQIYYTAIYRLKRWYPRFLVYILISITLKRYLIKTNAPESLIQLYKEFSKYTLNSAVKAYCKIGD